MMASSLLKGLNMKQRKTGSATMRKMPLLAMLAAISSVTSAEIYQWKDKDGTVHFGDKAPSQSKYVEVHPKINTYTHATYQQLKPGTNSVTSAASNRVVLYGTSWCDYCKQAKAYFDTRRINYIYLDVENDPAAKTQFKSMGGGGVPVIFVGNMRMNGFSPEAFDQMYARK